MGAKTRILQGLFFLVAALLLTMVIPLKRLEYAGNKRTALEKQIREAEQLLEARTLEHACVTDLVDTKALVASLNRTHPAVVLDIVAGLPAAETASKVATEERAVVQSSTLVKLPEELDKAVAALRKARPSLVSRIELAWAPFRYARIWADRQIVTRAEMGIGPSFRREGVVDNYEKYLATMIEKRDNFVERYLTLRHTLFPPLYVQLQQAARSNTIILMAFNSGSLPIFANWLCSCRRYGIDISNLLVYAADAKLKAFLDKVGILAAHMPSLFGTFEEKAARVFGDQSWLPFGQLKVLVPKMVMDGGFNVLFQDVDMVWFKDPLEEMTKNGSLADFDYRLQYVGNARVLFEPYNANSGYYYMHSNAYSRQCWDEFFYSNEKVGTWTSSQQLALNHYLGICVGSEHLRVTTLPREEYPSGWVQQDKGMVETISHREELLVLGQLLANGTLKEAVDAGSSSKLSVWQKDWVAARGKNEKQMRRDTARAERMVLYHLNWSDTTKRKRELAIKYRLWYLGKDILHDTDLSKVLPSPPTRTALNGLCQDPIPFEEAQQDSG